MFSSPLHKKACPSLVLRIQPDSSRVAGPTRMRYPLILTQRNHAPVHDHNTVLDVDRLSIRFGPTTILKDVSFQVSRGESVAVIGPNGSGKTVLFRALIGAIPSEGTLKWAEGIRFGYVPQKVDLARDLPITGIDFLRARAAFNGAAAAAVTEALSAVGLTRAVCGQSVGSLSGGQFQRLLIAFALMADPDVLLLDEPTAGVDEPGQERLNELINRLKAE